MRDMKNKIENVSESKIPKQKKVKANETENDVCRGVYDDWSFNTNCRMWSEEGG
ncbi:hypothetical protein GCM10008933_23210 [Paenibacillus motobuensis]|uniref:Uncharacterized protein n=1 Tax=Paenibacillus motobuensis TaxID=295324 RepID=A0ABN0YD76_9BACL